MFSWLPDDLRGKLLVNAYLKQLKSGKPSKNSLGELSEFSRKILHQPGNVSSMYRYLAGEGKNLIPEITEKHLGDHWYTGIAKKLSGTSLGNAFFLNRFLDKTLPTINGDNALAKKFMEAGGQV